ncbi:sensor histidine kinase [Parapedobacter tibetensis]|uniref:sensor histidine kinase n=1 Tax=Parapedobacter tibetensis TaxID=2972951 RepID=UPI00214D5CE8|nr:histidine kinase [Parapedobacter tibetensis]
MKSKALYCHKKWLIFLGLLVIARSGFSQDYAIAKLQLFPDRDEVLIKDVTCDSLGFIWFLTNGEIYRYDGYRSLDILKTIADQRLTDDMPQRILADRRNRLWMAGNANLSYLDLKTWTVHAVDSNLLPPVSLRMVSWIKQVADSTVMVAYENGHLLLINGDNYVRVDGLYHQSMTANYKVLPLSVTLWDGKYWIGTSAGTLLSIDPDHAYQTQYHQLPDIHRIILNLIAHDDGLIVNVFPNDLYRLQSNGEWDEFIPGDFSLAEDEYYVLGEGKQMHVYADTKSAYLLDADLGIEQRIAMPLKNEFGPKHVCIVGDEAVLGTEEGVFVVYPKTKGLSQFIPPNESTNKSTRGIYVYPDGAFFYSTYQGAGFVESDGTVWPFEQLRHAYVLYPINANELLVGTEGGFLKVFDRRRHQVTDINYALTPETKEKHAFNLPTQVMSLAETDSDYLIGSTGGLWLLNKENYSLRRFTDISGEPHGLDLHIRYIQLTPQGGMLLSTNVGLFEVSQETLTKRYPQSGNLGVYKSLAVGDTLWVATQGKGLVAIDAEGRILQTFTTEEGLSNNLIYSLEYADGILIAGTADGLNLIRNQQVRRIGTAEGLSQSEFNSGASFWDERRKRVYVGGLMGYTVLDMTQRWFDNNDQLESYVTEIHTSKGNTGAKSADYTWPYRGERTLVLQPGQSLTGLYVGTPGNHRADSEIRYTLSTGDWEPLELGQFISLIEPLPGDYRLKLETRSTAVDGWQKEFAIVKRPHYYQTWWFSALIVAVVMLLLLLWYRSRVRKIRREQAIRNRIAADLHDEVGSSLTRIYYQANILSSKGAATSGAKNELQLIADTSRQALLTMSDMVWSIDSRFDTISELVIRMKDYVYKLREELEIAYRFEMRGDYESRSLSQIVRQNLFLIFKEALTNAIKYGDGSEIVIELSFEHTLRLVLKNSYSTADVHDADRQGGRGIQSMEQRAAKMDGELSFTDADGIFQLTLVIP